MGSSFFRQMAVCINTLSMHWSRLLSKVTLAFLSYIQPPVQQFNSSHPFKTVCSFVCFLISLQLLHKYSKNYSNSFILRLENLQKIAYSIHHWKITFFSVMSLHLLQWSRGKTDMKDLKHEKSTVSTHAHLNHSAGLLQWSQIHLYTSDIPNIVHLLSVRKMANSKPFVMTFFVLKQLRLSQQIFSRQPMSLLSPLMLLTLSALSKTAIKLVPFSLFKEHIYQLWEL